MRTLHVFYTHHLNKEIQMSIFDTKEAKKIAKNAMKDADRELSLRLPHEIPESDPNHPMYDLHVFGEHYADFMRKQYK